MARACRWPTGSGWRWARSWSTAPCATSSACAVRAGATPAGRRRGPDTYRFFRSFGINLKQVYGATEATALISCQADAEANPNTVGRPVPRVEIKIDDRGEVLLKGPNVFKGYFKQEEVTADTITSDGWLKTGDAGFFDKQGHLVIIDRAKDVGKLNDGSAFAPQFIDHKPELSPFIRHA